MVDHEAALLTGLNSAFDDHTSDPNLMVTTVYPKSDPVSLSYPPDY